MDGGGQRFCWTYPFGGLVFGPKAFVLLVSLSKASQVGHGEVVDRANSSFSEALEKWCGALLEEVLLMFVFQYKDVHILHLILHLLQI